MIDTKKLKKKSKGIDINKINNGGSLLQKSNTFNKAKLDLEYLKNTRKELKIPSDAVPEERDRILSERKDLAKKIREKKKELKELNKVGRNLILKEEVEEYNRLAHRVDHSIKDFAELDPARYEKEKQNVTYKALKVFEENSKLATEGLLTVMQEIDSLPYGDGCYEKIRDNKGSIQNNLNLCFVDMAKKNMDITQYISPYTALFISIMAPVGIVFAGNYLEDKKKNKKTTIKKKELETKNTRKEEIISITAKQS